MIIDMEVNLPRENDDINIMDARNDNYIESINQIYDEDGDDKLDENKIRQAVLNRTVQSADIDRIRQSIGALRTALNLYLWKEQVEC